MTLASRSGPKGRLFRKYLITIAILVGGALLTSGVIDLFLSYRETRAVLADSQREKAASAATAIGRFVFGTEQSVREVTNTPRPTGTVGLSDRRVDYLRLLNRSPAVSEVRYLDREGKEQLYVSRFGLDVTGGGADASESAAFQRAKAHGIYYGPVYFRGESEPYLSMALVEPEPRKGVVAAEVNLKFIWDVVSQIKIGIAGLAYAVDSNGVLVAHPDNSLVLRKTDLASLPQVQAALAASRDPAKQQVEAAIARNLQGQRVLTAYQSIEPLGWQVFVEQPLGEAFAPLYSSILRTILLLLAGLALAVLTSFFLARKMVTPIQVLQAGAARIGAGSLDQRIDIHTGDELEILGDGFNRMAVQLREMYSNLEQKVAERTAELTASNEELEAFSYSVSHDLRAPLRSIDGFSQALLEDYTDKLDAQGKDHLQRVRAASQRMGQLIDDLVDLSRMTRREMRRETVDLSALAQSVASELKRREPGRQVRFAIAEGIVENGDPHLLRVVLENLLGNAWKFTGKHAQARIEFGVTHRGGVQLVYFVRDDGAGFDMAYTNKLFGAFQRLHSVTEFEGTGIGLATVQRIIHRHGGRVWAEGAVEKGATFYFTVG